MGDMADTMRADDPSEVHEPAMRRLGVIANAFGFRGGYDVHPYKNPQGEKWWRALIFEAGHAHDPSPEVAVEKLGQQLLAEREARVAAWEQKLGMERAALNQAREVMQAK